MNTVKWFALVHCTQRVSMSREIISFRISYSSSLSSWLTNSVSAPLWQWALGLYVLPLLLRWSRICLQSWRSQRSSLNWKDPLEKGMATHSSILAHTVSWTEEPDGLQSMGSQRVRHYSATNTRALQTLSLFS